MRYRYVVLVAVVIALTVWLAWPRSTRTTSFPSRSPKALRVHVVEEHHEVLPIWHEAIEGPISVLHIVSGLESCGSFLFNLTFAQDAHEDTAAPSVVGTNVISSMSANDVHVINSLMLGKLKSFTWMWPSWDVNGPRHKLLYKGEYVEGKLKDIANSGLFNIKAGSVTVDNKDGIAVDIGCTCMYFAASGKLVKCEMGDESYETHLAEKLDASVTEMYREVERRCQWKASMPMQHVSDMEMVAGSYVQADKMQDTPTSLVLDIDEDFFGVLSLRDTKILMGSLSSKLLDRVSSALKRVRVTTVASETGVNDALRKDIHATWKECWEGPVANAKCSSSSQATVLSTSTVRQLSKLLSSSDYDTVPQLGEALHALIRSSPNAAHLLNAYGFCLATSPETYRHKSGGFAADGKQIVGKGMKICADSPSRHAAVHNDPSFVTRAASDSPFEIARRFKVMAKALKRELRVPAVVTICRSIRDGYAYPGHWAQIEAGILRTLEEAYGPLDVRYDKNLLGGAEGWTRHAAPLD